MYQHLRHSLLGVFLAASVAGCVSVQLPSIAHVHVGHTITAWPETAGKKGLFPIAEEEAKIVSEHAGYAVAGARDIAQVKMHLGHVLNALNPALEAQGPGTGYGLLKALDGSADHLGFAREVKDASENLKSGLLPVIESLRQARQDAQVVAVLARDARQSPDLAQVVAYAEEVQQRAHQLVAKIGGARKQLDALLAAESPPYRPIAQRYLFGIIRLPSGEWAYKPDVQREGRVSGYY
jgi:hypothetical protein